MASSNHLQSLLDRPTTTEGLLDTAHHITASYLLERPSVFLPFVCGVRPQAFIQMLHSPTPVCTLDFLVYSQSAFRSWGVDRYMYVTPTTVQEQCIDPSLSKWLIDSGFENVANIPVLFTMAVTKDDLRVRYTMFDHSSGTVHMTPIAQHQYAKPEHFSGPYSRLLSCVDLSTLKPLESNPSLH